MESEPNQAQKKETMSIVIVLLLIVVGGIFYSLDLYNKTKASATVPPTETIGPVQTID
jgi:hypothetical protein